MIPTGWDRAAPVEALCTLTVASIVGIGPCLGMGWRFRGDSGAVLATALRRSRLQLGGFARSIHAAAACRRVHAVSRLWEPPEGTKVGISLKNSLTGNKEPLVVPDGQPLTWYSCGPTVYDAAHLGHARNYVCLDILHRVLTDHYGIPVLQVINITDIDDKIILRAAEQGVSVGALSRHWEREFQRDLAMLGVRPPAAWLRVSDHMNAIIGFIQRLVDGGMAYRASDGTGVYFDVESLPRYGVLRKLGHEEEEEKEEEEEGALQEEREEQPAGQGEQTGKRSKRDFALWKNFPVDQSPGRNGESLDASWDSPWGVGRPGWHIECSAIAETVFGDELVMHTGGIDLAFPHHENELAQCEAVFNLNTSSDWRSSKAKQGYQGANDVAETWHRWCHYFVHTGHLHIAGRKMSKSLKNFISINEFLSLDSTSPTAAKADGQKREQEQEHCGTAGSFRMFCLLHKYNSNVVYSPARIDDATKVLKRINAFFSRAHRLLHASIAAPAPSSALKRGGEHDPWGESSKSLVESVWSARERVEAALADDLDTPTAIAVLLHHISYTHGLLDKDEQEASAAALLDAGTVPATRQPLAGLWVSVRYVADVCRLFGLDDAETGAFDSLQLSTASNSDASGTPTDGNSVVAGNWDRLSAAEFNSTVEEILRLRGIVRSAAMSKRPLEVGELWSICDKFRDDLLAGQLGVSLKDHRDGTTSWERKGD